VPEEPQIEYFGDDWVRAPPPPQIKEQVALGVLNPKQVRLPPSDRCRCGHLSGAHDERPERRVCRARACRRASVPCLGFVQDPRYLLPEFNSRPSVQIELKPAEA